jgi:Fe-S cluster assembly protein SufD
MDSIVKIESARRDSGGPAWLVARRAEAEIAWKNLPWPEPKDPRWRNSPIELFQVETYSSEAEGPRIAAPPSVPGAAPGSVNDSDFAAVLRFVDGEAAWASGDEPRLPGLSVALGPGWIPDSASRFFGEDVLSDKLHARLWAEASPFITLRIARDTVLEKPILLDWIDGREGRYSAPFVILNLESGARTRLDLRWRSPESGEGRGVFLSPALFLDLDHGSRLDLFELVELSLSSRFLDYPAAILGEGAELEWRRGFFGSGIVKSRMYTRLEGRSARFTAAGAYAVAAGQHLDLSVVQRHEGPQTWSRSRFDGVADGDGRASCHGLIKVDASATGTDAYLSSRALALSPEARTVSLPELAIDTNDLTASHGSTVGSIDPDELFYLGTRGLSPAQAKSLVAAGVLGSLLENAPSELSELVESLIDGALASRAAQDPAARSANPLTVLSRG